MVSERQRWQFDLPAKVRVWLELVEGLDAELVEGSCHCM